jgi:predicted transcriptional regulator
MKDPLRSRAGRVKLTAEISRDVVKRLKQASLDEERDVWRIVERALRQYLDLSLAQREDLPLGMVKQGRRK